MEVKGDYLMALITSLPGQSRIAGSKCLPSLEHLVASPGLVLLDTNIIFHDNKFETNLVALIREATSFCALPSPLVEPHVELMRSRLSLFQQHDLPLTQGVLDELKKGLQLYSVALHNLHQATTKHQNNGTVSLYENKLLTASKTRKVNVTRQVEALETYAADFHRLVKIAAHSVYRPSQEDLFHALTALHDSLYTLGYIKPRTGGKGDPALDTKLVLNNPTVDFHLVSTALYAALFTDTPVTLVSHDYDVYHFLDLAFNLLTAKFPSPSENRRLQLKRYPVKVYAGNAETNDFRLMYSTASAPLS